MIRRWSRPCRSGVSPFRASATASAPSQPPLPHHRCTRGVVRGCGGLPGGGFRGDRNRLRCTSVRRRNVSGARRRSGAGAVFALVPVALATHQIGQDRTVLPGLGTIGAAAGLGGRLFGLLARASPSRRRRFAAAFSACFRRRTSSVAAFSPASSAFRLALGSGELLVESRDLALGAVRSGLCLPGLVPMPRSLS
jgi:hypothetical protein